MHQNIAGLISKLDPLIVQLDEFNSLGKTIDVLCISEHNMKLGDENVLVIPNYRLAPSFFRQKEEVEFVL